MIKDKTLSTLHQIFLRICWYVNLQFKCDPQALLLYCLLNQYTRATIN